MTNSSTQNLKKSIQKVHHTTRFEELTERISKALEALEQDTSILEFQKKAARFGAEKAIDQLIRRKESVKEFEQTLSTFSQKGDGLEEEELKKEGEGLCKWFYHLAYSNSSLSNATEEKIRPFLEMYQSNSGSNTHRLSLGLRKYERFAKWDIEYDLTKNNLNGLVILARLLPLDGKAGFKLTQRVQKILSELEEKEQNESGLEPEQLIRERIKTFQGIFAPIVAGQKKKQKIYLDQNDSFVIHVCLERFKGMLMEHTSEMRESLLKQVNDLRAQFQSIRYRSSTYLFKKVLGHLNAIEEEVSRSFDFHYLFNEIKQQQKFIKDSQRGGPDGTMSNFHVENARAIASRIYTTIKVKEKDSKELKIEVLRLEEMVKLLEERTPSPSYSATQQIQWATNPDSALGYWITRCFKPYSNEKNEIVARLKIVKNKCQVLWKKAEDTEDERIEEFVQNCSKLKSLVEKTYEFQEVIEELGYLKKTVQEFKRIKQKELFRKIDGVRDTIKRCMSNEQLLSQKISALTKQIDQHHKRIFYYIDFDKLHSQAIAISIWSKSHWFNSNRKRHWQKQARGLSKKLGTLKWRQEKFKSERSQKDLKMLEQIVREGVDESINDPGNPRSWEILGDLNVQIRRSKKLVKTDREHLYSILDKGFEGVRKLRSEFAAGSSIVFSGYSDMMNNTMAVLEKNPNRQSAIEAIGVIKPLRVKLRNENRLLRTHKKELNTFLSTLSNTIDDVFEKAHQKLSMEYHQLKMDLEKLEEDLKSATVPAEVHALIPVHKEISGKIGNLRMPISTRKEMRGELEQLWSGEGGISEKLRFNKRNRTTPAEIKKTLKTLINGGHLIMCRSIPSIKF